MVEYVDVLNNIDILKKGEKVYIIYGEGGADQYEGFVESITDRHLTILDYVPDIYRTFNRESIVEISIVKYTV
jgi:hypothetical protein